MLMGDTKLFRQDRFYLFEPAIALAHLFLNSGRGGKLKCQSVVFKPNRLGSCSAIPRYPGQEL